MMRALISLPLLVAGTACLLQACSGSSTIDDATAASLIKQSYEADRCSRFFSVGQPTIRDKLASTLQGGQGASAEVIVEAVTPLSKTADYENVVERATLMTLATTPCASDFLSPAARFGDTDPAFRGHPVGTTINMSGKYRFQRWDSGWRLVGAE